jgi:hypothetical protein
MNKRDQMPPKTRTRRDVNQGHTFGLKAAQFGCNFLAAKGQMVQPRPAFLQKFSDGGVWAAGGEQFKSACILFWGLKHVYGHPLALDFAAGLKYVSQL